MLKRFLCSSSAGAVRAARLETRSALRIGGPEAGKFLQGLVSNDVVGEQHALAPVVYAHMLTARGRVRYDMMIYPSRAQNSAVLDYVVEVDKDDVNDVKQALSQYRMRSQVELSESNGEWHIWTVNGDMDKTSLADVSCRFGPDPRLAGFHRVAMPSAASLPLQVDTSLVDDYTEARYRHGLCEGRNELERNSVLPLEHNLDIYKGVCFKKGCYVGQELTTRTHFTGVVRKRALPVHLVSGSGADVRGGIVRYQGEGGMMKRAGRVCAWFGDRGIAVLPVDYVSSAPQLLVDSEGVDSPVIAISELSPVLAEGIALMSKGSTAKQ